MATPSANFSGPGGLPLRVENIVTAPLLERFRGQISGPARVMLVVVVDDTGCTARAHVRGDLPDADPSSFGRDLHRIWSRHDVGAVVPIVMTRLNPPLTQASLARLPWGGEGAWCARCGTRLAAPARAELCEDCIALARSEAGTR
jgi:hypothetical protein